MLDFIADLDSNTYFFVVITLGVIFIYLVIPISVKGKVWVDPQPVPSIDSREIENWPDVVELLEIGDQIEAMGYQKEELLIFDGMMPNTMFFIQPLRNLDQACLGMISIGLSKVLDKWRVAEQKVEFQSFFSDKSSISTAFALTLELIDPPKGRQDFIVTWTEEPDELLAIHNRLIGHLAPNQQPMEVVQKLYDGDTTRFILQSLCDEWERYCAAGIFYRSEGRGTSPVQSMSDEPINPYAAPNTSRTANRLLLTYKGACYLTWSVSAPFKQIRRWRAGRKTKRVLRRC